MLCLACKSWSSRRKASKGVDSPWTYQLTWFYCLQEQDILRNIVVPCEENPLPAREVEVDEFTYHYTASEKPHIQARMISEGRLSKLIHMYEPINTLKSQLNLRSLLPFLCFNLSPCPLLGWFDSYLTLKSSSKVNQIFTDDLLSLAQYSAWGIQDSDFKMEKS